jgi:hypothetical protein
VRDAQNAAAGELERRIPLAVALERRPRAVELVAVDLDHQSLPGPVEVDHVAGDDNVAVRLGNPGFSDQGQESPLEL